MKKLIPLLLAISMLFAMLPLSALADETVKYGDVDGQDGVTSVDALSVLRSIVGLETLSEEQMVLADVDTVPGISSTDALCILQYSVGILTTLDPNRFDFALLFTDKATFGYTAESLRMTLPVISEYSGGELPGLKLSNCELRGEDTLYFKDNAVTLTLTKEGDVAKAHIQYVYNPETLSTTGDELFTALWFLSDPSAMEDEECLTQYLEFMLELSEKGPNADGSISGSCTINGVVIDVLMTADFTMHYTLSLQ